MTTGFGIALGLLVILLTALLIALGVSLSRLKKASREREEDLMNLLIALSSLLEMKDRYTEGHCIRMRNMVAAMGEELQLGKKQVENAVVAATLHDIGKIGVPDALLNKPGRLTPDEFEFMKQHAIFGSSSLASITRFRDILNIVRHHHERFDGAGYPDGLKGDFIPIGSRIIAVIDAYDAMTSDRAYRKSYTSEKAVQVIREESGKQFDPEMAEVFIKLLQKPAGTVIDPVCGMPAGSGRLVECDGTAYYFCSEACREEFQKNPSKYQKTA